MPTESVTTETILRLSEKVSLQPLGEGEGGVILRLDTGELYTVNDTALSFVGALDGTRTFAGSVRIVAEEYEVELDELTRDLTEIAEDLLYSKLVEQVG